MRHGAGRARPLVSAPPVRLPFILTVPHPHLIQRKALIQPGGAERAKHTSQQELQEGRQQQRLLSQHDVGVQAAPGQKGRQKPCRGSPKSALGAPSLPMSRAEVGGRGQSIPSSCPVSKGTHSHPRKGEELPVTLRGGQKQQPETRRKQEHTDLPGPAPGCCQHNAAGLCRASPRCHAVR